MCVVELPTRSLGGGSCRAPTLASAGLSCIRLSADLLKRMLIDDPEVLRPVANQMVHAVGTDGFVEVSDHWEQRLEAGHLRQLVVVRPLRAGKPVEMPLRFSSGRRRLRLPADIFQHLRGRRQTDRAIEGGQHEAHLSVEERERTYLQGSHENINHRPIYQFHIIMIFSYENIMINEDIKLLLTLRLDHRVYYFCR